MSRKRPKDLCSLLKQPGNRKTLLLLDLTVRKQRTEGVSFGTGQGLELGTVKVVEPRDEYVLHCWGSLGSQRHTKTIAGGWLTAAAAQGCLGWS
jgi:hypothetical protein